MARKAKLLLFSLVCLISMSIGMFLLLTPSFYTTDAKTLNTTVYLYGENGLSWKNATVNTFTKTADGHTYTLYGGNASYNVKQGTDGPDPDFDWGHAYINSYSSTNSHSTSGSASSLKKNAINCFIENFNSNCYTVYAYVYHNGSKVKTIYNFDSSSNANYDSGKEAQYRSGSSGDSNFTVRYYVSPKAVTGYVYYKYGSTTSYITSISSRYGLQVTLPSISPKVGYHFQEWRDGSGNMLSTWKNTAYVIMYSLGPSFYAYCPANTYYVRYNKNSSYATGSMSNSTFTYDKTGYLSYNAFSRPGYSFAGWSTSSTGSVVYSNNQSIYNLTSTNNATIDLYAVWTPNSYQLIANANSGTISSISGWNGSGTSVYKYVTFDSAYGTLPTENYMTKTGYNFLGWYTSQSGGSAVSSDTKMTSLGANIYAHWQAKHCSIILDKAGGSGGDTNLTVYYDSPIEETYTTPPTRNGYTFEGYYTESGGNGTKYYDSSGNRVCHSVWKNAVDDAVTFYAYWSPITYNIKFNTNGANSSLPSGISNPSKYNIEGSTTDPLISALPTPTRTGYGFTNWSVTSNGGNWTESSYNSGEPVSGKYGNVTLTANWNALSWDLTFNPNGGSVTPTSKKVTIDTAYGELPTPTRPGYIFNGWYTSSSGGSLVTTSTVMSTAGATIYAQWLETWASNITENDKYKGSGTINDPYEISTAEQLAYLAREVQKGTTFAEGERKYFVQTAPINLSGKIWLPIGGSEIESGTTSFGGIYNGGGFAIIGLKTESQKFNNVGLFGRTSGAKLMNIYVLNAEVKGKANVGLLVGENKNKPLEISCCFAKGVVNGVSSVGGLVGNDKVTGLQINNSGFAGSVTGGSIIVGTMAGGKIENCYAEVNSNISFCGSSSGVTIDACVFETSSGKYYYSDKTTKNGITFDGWTTYQGKPLPSGITWIGGVSSTGATLDGYTKVD